MENCILTTRNSRKKQGFTLLELMVSIAVVGTLSAVALPSLNDFLVKMRVDNEISELQRLLLIAKNTAINTGKNTTVCPLTADNSCGDNWQGKISVFTNAANDNNKYEAADDELVKIKEATTTGDTLKFANSSVVYAPTGRLLTNAGTFSYCPKDKANENRGVAISISGRSYTTSDTDNDGKDEDRLGNEISC